MLHEFCILGGGDTGSTFTRRFTRRSKKRGFNYPVIPSRLPTVKAGTEIFRYDTNYHLCFIEGTIPFEKFSITNKKSSILFNAFYTAPLCDIVLQMCSKLPVVVF